ncbi:glutamate--cysteine ligase [Polycladidibacter hongkongensis]|uniref:glutamate--cysteine ligase n=1 Tax=Polycladidibacter hongkongensis TaxID=1647556 RepID=UPI00082BD776|nr:glutamate--cysteine ligase [Pseudovibrio hongkongensis]
MSLKSHLLDTLDQACAQKLVEGLRVGIEKEALRVTANGRISPLLHPEKLGRALTHRSITTDFAEAQLEFITGANTDTSASLTELRDLHIFAAKNIPEGEIFWNASMPPALAGEDEIQIATYGSCNAARLKTLYRQGLAYRYGKTMQTISGIHYNFSFPDEYWQAMRAQNVEDLSLQEYRSEGYLSLLRNLQRHGWLLLYLFGASPALDASYTRGAPQGLEQLGAATLYGPYATSLRMSDLGYSSVVQGKLDIHFNSMHDYLFGLRAALETSEQVYEEIGLGEDGAHKQINTHQLQLENELYGSVRPKRVGRNGERPIRALCNHGVEYIELRSLDVNPLIPVGIDAEQVTFLNVFLTLMVLLDSPAISAEQQAVLQDQLRLVAREGRRPNLQMPALETSLSNAAGELLEAALTLAEKMDGAETAHFSRAVLAQMKKVEEPERTPSAQVLERVLIAGSWQAFMQDMAAAQTANLRAVTLPSEVETQMQALVSESVAAHAQLESDEELEFEQYLAGQRYYQRAPEGPC